uniref:pyruvate kinase n=1 Tax=Daucus carota subsp. sativus TaxID=79200 RepID=A0A161XTV0_DAUCS
MPQPLILLPGQEFTFTIRRGVGTTDCVSVNYDDFVNDVDAGNMLLVDVVKCKDEDLVKCEVVDGSELKSRRHLNVRGKSATLQSITGKDWDDIKFGVDNKIDFYAVSLVKDDEAMVARGDLGAELPVDEVPSLQYGKSFYSGNKYVRKHDCSSTPTRAGY